jgi:hypothetical protein
MNVKHIALTVAAMALGAAAGYYARTDVKDTSSAVESEAAVAERGKAVDDNGAAAGMKALRRRIAELEAELAKVTAEKTQESVAVASVPPAAPVRRESHSERMERMKKEEPERYAQMTNRFAAWRRQRAEAARSRIDFLSSIDTSRMSKSAKAVHAQLQQVVAEREELEAGLHQEGLSDEERHRIFGELRRTGAKMHELSMKERDNLLAETARNLGFEGEDSAEIVTTVKEIIEATDSGRWHGFGRGGHRGRR